MPFGEPKYDIPRSRGEQERTDVSLETEEKERLFQKVVQGLMEEFGPILSGKDETRLNQLHRNTLEVRDSGEFYRKMGGIDLSTLLFGEESFPATEGVVGINPYNFEPKIIYKKIEGESPKAIADKICHEAIHYLGFRLEEISKAQEGVTLPDIELLKDYKVDSVVTLRLGPLHNIALVFALKSAPEVKIILYLPSGDREESSFWEGVVDYYSKRIIEKLNLPGEYTAGYEQSTAIALTLGAVANIISEKSGRQYEEIKEELDQALKVALLSGDETSFERILSSITPAELQARLKNTSENLRKKGLLELAKRLESSLPEKLDAANKSTYQWLKSFIANYADYKG